MIDAFKPLEEVDIEGFMTFNEDLDDLLMRMDGGELFTDGGYSPNDFKLLLESLVSGQRGSLGRTKPGSWSIAPDDSGMDADARVEFIFTPTYYVTAILSRTLCDYPSLAHSIPGFVGALKRGMLFCSYRQLHGHGYEAWAGIAEALTILAIGKTPHVLEHDKEFCPELYAAIVNVTKEMQETLAKGTAYGMWGEDLQEQYSSALETLYVMSDPETYEAIMGSVDDSDLLSEGDLAW